MKISVALCTYNGEKYIRRQLDSILDQKRKVDEILIFDDCSTDGTFRILQAYHQQHPSVIKIKQNAKNLKSVKNFEQAISSCSGEIIFLSDQDDIWTKEKTDFCIKYFEAHPNINVLCSNGHIINENDQEIDAITLWDVPTILIEKGEHINYFHCITYRGNIATGATMAIRKEYVNRIRPIPSIKYLLHDEWIALLASCEQSFAMLNQKLIYYRVHRDQQVGGVSYPNNDLSRTKLYNNFSSIEDESFSARKRVIKQIVSKYQKFSNDKGNASMNIILDAITERYVVARKGLVENYPIRGRVLSVIDKLRNKRQLT